jgi:hypothetical protein
MWLEPMKALQAGVREEHMWQRTRAVRQTLPSLKSIADDIYCRRSPAERIAQRPGDPAANYFIVSF